MATKRKRTSESNTGAEADAQARKPTRRPTPRKRTDAPPKAQRSGKIKPVKKAATPEKTEQVVVPETVDTPKAPPVIEELVAPSVVPEMVSPTTPPAQNDAVPADEPLSKTSALRSKVASKLKPTPRPSVSAAFDPVDEEIKPREKKHTAKKLLRHWPLIVVSVVLVLVVAVVGGLSWDRWLRFDDAADIQGEWQTPGSTVSVVIDGESIKLTEDVTWSYTLDSGAKTLAYTFGNYEGQGRYLFSPDRTQLVITDGANYSWFSTLTDDLASMIDRGILSLQGKEPEPVVSSDSRIVLNRALTEAPTPPQSDAVAPAPADEAANADTAIVDDAVSDAPPEDTAGTDASAYDGVNENDTGGQDPVVDGGAATEPEADNGAPADAGQGDIGASAPIQPSDVFDVNDPAA